jgi:hypothetical protein
MSNLAEALEQDRAPQTRKEKKEMCHEARPFPKGDERWKDMFDIKRYNKLVHIYHNEKGEQLYGIARRDFIDDEGDADKQITQFSYCGIAKNFVNKQLYSQTSQLYDVHLFPHINNNCKSLQLGFVEGETTMDAGNKLFPHMLWTTASGGVKNLKHIEELSVLRGFQSITFWADNDKGGKNNFLKLAQQVQDTFPDIVVKYVDLPRELPNKWDLANKVDTDGINVFEMLNDAVPINEYSSFNNLKRDSKNGRHIFVKSSGDGYHDTITNKLTGEKVLNNLYLRDTSISTKAHAYLHAHDCDVVEGYMFKPTTETIIKKGNSKYLNKYTPVNIDPLSDQLVQGLKNDEDIKLMLNHIKRSTSKDDYFYRHLLSTIAHDVQHPTRNRIWGVLMCSKPGWGKTWLWRLLQEFNGRSNTQWIDQEDIVSPYRNWMLDCNMVIIDELRWDKNEKQFISKCKRLFTEEDHRVELKYKNKIELIAHYNIWVSSNDFVPFSVDQEERRWHIIHIDETKEELIADTSPDYYAKLHRLLKDEKDKPNYEFIAKAYAFFKSYKIDYTIFDKNNAPITNAKEELKSLSLTQNQHDLNDLLHEGKAPFDRHIVCAESILQEVRNNDITNRSRFMFQGLDRTAITNWLRDILGAKKVNNGKVIQLGADSQRRNYWAIKEISFWSKCTDFAVMREHMKGNDNARQKIIPFKEKQDDQSRDRGSENTPF